MMMTSAFILLTAPPLTTLGHSGTLVNEPIASDRTIEPIGPSFHSIPGTMLEVLFSGKMTDTATLCLCTHGTNHVLSWVRAVRENS
uniref:Putative secreted protein n=1 Tax=Anopheles darlingi TaxID=43151 RepID=A0A2M4DNR2_ANODA